VVVANLVRSGRKQPQRFRYGSSRLPPRMPEDWHERGQRRKAPTDDMAWPWRTFPKLLHLLRFRHSHAGGNPYWLMFRQIPAPEFMDPRLREDDERTCSDWLSTEPTQSSAAISTISQASPWISTQHRNRPFPKRSESLSYNPTLWQGTRMPHDRSTTMPATHRRRRSATTCTASRERVNFVNFAPLRQRSRHPL
jgi:hypothetical protein